MKRLLVVILGWMVLSAGVSYAGLNDNGDGTVTDTSTELTWQQETAGPMTWEEALAYCDSLSLGQQDDWRLPTIKELDSIADLSTFDPAIDVRYFADTQSEDYWSSTTGDDHQTNTWVISFSNSDDGLLTKTETAYVRAVRGGAITPQPPDDFINNGDGTITDRRTGHMWQQRTTGPLTWEEALAHCDGLVLGEYDDWRMPSLKELDNIADLSVYSPSIDTRYFPATQPANYWSSTTDTGSRTSAWIISFSDSDDGTLAKTETAYVRAIRGGQMAPKPPATFVDNTNGTVTDRRTGLTWQKEAGTAMNWQQALAYCDNLDLIGRKDWRLPTFKELDSIVDLAVNSPSINTRYFPATPSDNYWTSTTRDGSRTSAWVINFNSGDDGILVKTEIAYVRGVLGGKAGTPGVLHHFDISFDYSPKAVEVAFDAKITAMDVFNQTVTSFNGEVVLTTTFGTLDPDQVKLNNGTWQGLVEVLSPGEGRLKANGAGKEGISKSFIVTGTGQDAGIVEGWVFGTDKKFLSGATVFIQRDSETPLTMLSDDNGFFKFTGLSCSECSLWATFGENAESESFRVQPQFNALVIKILCLHSTGNPSELTPILLVPGILGSSLGGGGEIPVLHKDVPAWDDIKWANNKSHGLHDPLGHPGWRSLIQALGNTHGYEMNVTLFAVPYDWRKDLGDIARNYLKKKIDLARKKAGTDKVHIIAHSMGGLVTRWYIQNGYDGYIDRFAMVGTPNHGSANPYYMWFGGDPKTADDITDGLLTAWVNIYSNTTQRLYQEMNEGEQLFPVSEVGVKPITKWNDSAAMRKAREFYAAHCKGLRTLLAVYPFLQKENASDGNGSVPFGINDNETLINLNKEFTLNGVKACIFAGKSEKTIQTIHIGTENDMYVYGAPTKEDPDRPESGDGTVLQTSAEIGSVPVIATEEGEHSDLINVYQEQIIEFIWTGEVSASQNSREASTVRLPIAPELSLQFTGAVSPYVLDPTGKALGINPNTDHPENTFADADLTMDGGYALMSISDPPEGVYSVTIKAVAATQCRVNVGYVSESAVGSRSRMIMVSPGITEFSFVLTPAVENPLVIEETPAVTQNVQANTVEQTGLKTRITWTAPADASITGYRVYGKDETSPFLSLLGVTSALVFDTGDAWAATSVIPVRLYAVSSVSTDGKESFLSPLIKNNDRDHDGMTDAEETAFGTDLDNPDTDGDGLKDGDEQTHGTNPLVQDTDGDGWSDYMEIQAGTDPLDPASSPPSTIPTVTTTAVTSITHNSGMSGGNVTSTGGADIIARGVCWNISENPTTSGSKTTDSPGTGSFISSITGLTADTPYYVRAYATNSAGTAYGSNISFETAYSSVLYVNNDGICDGNSPCHKTIQAAIDAAATGSVILVSSGDYSESLSLGGDRTILIEGGYNETYEHQTANTTFIQAPGPTNIKASSGSLRFQMINVK